MKDFAKELLKELIVVSVTTFAQSAMQNYANRLTSKSDEREDDETKQATEAETTEDSTKTDDDKTSVDTATHVTTTEPCHILPRA